MYKRQRVRRVSRRRISKNETRIPATMRLNNSFGAKESTRFRCLSLDITVSIFFSFPLSLSFLFFFPPLTWKPDSVWTRNNSSCSLVFTFGPFQRDATFNLPDENFIRAIPPRPRLVEESALSSVHTDQPIDKSRGKRFSLFLFL